MRLVLLVLPLRTTFDLLHQFDKGDTVNYMRGAVDSNFASLGQMRRYTVRAAVSPGEFGSVKAVMEGQWQGLRCECNHTKDEEEMARNSSKMLSCLPFYCTMQEGTWVDQKL